MTTSYKMAAVAAVVFSTFAIAGTLGSGAAMAAEPDGGPNDAYCIRSAETGSPWCGYATFAQCQETASGTGGDCVANAFGEPSEDRRVRPHSSVIR
jgi:hypothetical protein